MKKIKYYFWFIKESQSFMKGYNPIKVFFQSLYKGIWFVKSVINYDKLTSEQKLNWYANRPLDEL